MSESFRARLLDWLERRGVKGRRSGGSVVHEAMIEGDQVLHVSHDPLTPGAAAQMCLRIGPLPYDLGSRRAWVRLCLDLNRRLVLRNGFGLRLEEGGAFIALSRRALARPVSGRVFRSEMEHFLGQGRAARQALSGGTQRSGADLAVRYL